MPPLFQQFEVWIVPLGLTLGTLTAAWIIGYVISRRAISWLFAWPVWARGTWDDAVVAALRPRIPWWSVLVGAWLSTSYWPLSAQAQLLASRLVFALMTLSVTVAVASIASRLVADYGARVTPAVPVTTLTQNIAWILIVGIGLLILLHGLGVSITPLVTAFGVGGLAVALALQDPLANFFAGLMVTLTRHVRMGDYIRLDSGVEGEVVDFSWRLTRLRTPGERIVLVPNTKLAQAIVTNYSGRAGDPPVAIELGVDLDSDLAQVEQAIAEVGREMASAVPGAAAAPPAVRYHAVGGSAIKFTVLLRGGAPRDQHLITHEFLRRLHARFRQDGITMRL